MRPCAVSCAATAMGRPSCMGWSRIGGAGDEETGQTAFFEAVDDGAIQAAVIHHFVILSLISAGLLNPHPSPSPPSSRCVRARRQVSVIPIPAAPQQTSATALPCFRCVISPHSNSVSHADHSRSNRPKHPDSSGIFQTLQRAGRTAQIHVRTTITVATVNTSRTSHNLRS